MAAVAVATAGAATTTTETTITEVSVETAAIVMICSLKGCYLYKPYAAKMRAFQNSSSVIIRRLFAAGLNEAVVLCSRLLEPTLLLDCLEAGNPGEAGPTDRGVETLRLSIHHGTVGTASDICGHERT